MKSQSDAENTHSLDYRNYYHSRTGSLPKIYQTEDDQYIIYWDSIHWFESSDKREAELVRAFNRAFDYLEECPFDQDGNILPGYDFESIILEADSDDYQYRSNDSKSIIWPEKRFICRRT